MESLYKRQKHSENIRGDRLNRISYDQTSCPNCGKIAEDQMSIETQFGFRNMGDGTIRVQSWCKECRNKCSRSVIA